MSFALKWKEAGEGRYVAGVSKGVVFPWDDASDGFGAGVAWDGLTAVSKGAEGGERTEIYADNKVYAMTVSQQKATGSVEAFDFPEEFGPCIGKKKIADGVYAEQQGIKPFAFVYREDIGDNSKEIGAAIDPNYKLTFMFHCYAGAPEEAAATISDTPEPVSYSFDLTCLNVSAGDNYKPLATIVVEKYGDDGVGDDTMTAIEEMIYGKEAGGDNTAVEPKMPTPEELIALVSEDNTSTGGDQE